MAKTVKQFRYYSDNENERANNNPTNISKDYLVSGEVFAPYMPISQIGI